MPLFIFQESKRDSHSAAALDFGLDISMLLLLHHSLGLCNISELSRNIALARNWMAMRRLGRGLDILAESSTAVGGKIESWPGTRTRIMLLHV
ncbi:hypothetical protein RchiOBHm_Chr5g0068521 [Rosa chinensis]|uniref:Uncharacterized protein n=1 Tax=Rosa chinensis TaxID=74649 RepID=A0A2P6QJP4_ROSCH|nr:hypothetical protein RchiOBHm_Chr5g0068521 [Rosa chinensis]